MDYGPTKIGGWVHLTAIAPPALDSWEAMLAADVSAHASLACGEWDHGWSSYSRIKNVLEKMEGSVWYTIH
jgi:hypothetical protein